MIDGWSWSVWIIIGTKQFHASAVSFFHLTRRLRPFTPSDHTALRGELVIAGSSAQPALLLPATRKCDHTLFQCESVRRRPARYSA